MGAVTMKTVAQALGVSVTSVSNAFNRPDRISEQLRRTIVDGAAELGYFGPDAAGRMLRSGRSNTYGVLFNEKLSYAFTDPYAVLLLSGFAEVLEARELAVTLLPLPADPERAAAVVNEAVVDGLMGLCATDLHPGVIAARRRGLPVVLTDISELGDYVSIDDREAGSAVAQHIAGLGHRTVAMLYDDLGSDEVRGAREPQEIAAVLDMLRDIDFPDAVARVSAVTGLPDTHVTLWTAGRNLRENGRRCAAAALDATPAPTAIVATSDVLALGALDELQRRGLEPGRDVAVTGFDGLSDALAVGLTTMIQPTRDKGRTAAELLLDPDRPERRLLLPVTLEVGRTTVPE